MEIRFTCMDSPVGPLLLLGDESALWALKLRPGDVATELTAFASQMGLRALPREGRAAALEQTEAELEAYFNHRRQFFTVPLHLAGTSFQIRVWQALREIPYGQVRSYADVARRIGSPRAVRAVGSANGKNPIPIIVPCHRVIQSDGGLGGYSGGLDVKHFLLKHEGVPRGDADLIRVTARVD